MAVEGSLDLFQLPEILQIIAQEKKTGILTVQGESDIVAISFLRGTVVAADALNQTIEDGLGEVLLERHLLTAETLESAIMEQRRAGGRLIDILVDKGGLARADLLEALRVLTYRLLEGLLGWRSGEFKFYSGEEVSYEPGFVPISVEDLLLRTLPQVEAPPPEAAPQVRPAAPPEPEAPKPKPPEPVALEPPEPEPVAPVVPPTPAPVVELAEAPLRRPPSPLREVEEAPKAVTEPVSEAPFRRRGAAPWHALPTVLAVLGVIALTSVLMTRPTDLILPFPSWAGVRAAYGASRWQAQYSKIDGAVRTFYLLEGRLPADLRELVAIGLLVPDDLDAPEGGTLTLQGEGETYQIRSSGGGDGFQESIHGDFLLDAGFATVRDDHQTPPLVLLD